MYTTESVIAPRIQQLAVVLEKILLLKLNLTCIYNGNILYYIYQYIQFLANFLKSNVGGKRYKFSQGIFY